MCISRRYIKLKQFNQQCNAISWKLLLTIFDDVQLPFCRCLNLGDSILAFGSEGLTKASLKMPPTENCGHRWWAKVKTQAWVTEQKYGSYSLLKLYLCHMYIECWVWKYLCPQIGWQSFKTLMYYYSLSVLVTLVPPHRRGVVADTFNANRQLGFVHLIDVFWGPIFLVPATPLLLSSDIFPSPLSHLRDFLHRNTADIYIQNVIW